MIEIKNGEGVVLLTSAAMTLVRINLHKAILEEANLRGANLWGAILSKATLAGADLGGAILCEANLTEADLTDADLTGADLHEANLGGAVLWEARLDGARLPNGETWEEYLAVVVPALLTAGGKRLAEVAAEPVWDCPAGENSPLGVAFGVKSAEDCPLLLRPRAREFVQFFVCGLVPRPQVRRGP